MKEIKEFGFISTVRESEQTGQKVITIPFGVREKYLTNRRYKVTLDLIPEDEDIEDVD